MLLITAVIPDETIAQRFSHGGSGGGGRSYAPAPRPPAPAPARQEPVRQQPVQNRATINGGSRNIGNHDLSRNRNTTQPVHENVKKGADVHENESVYHTGAYHGLRPYSYHPYHPYYWGPRWHPVGFFLNALAANSFRFYVGSQWYYYDDGCYYEPYNDGYTVVAPPLGADVSYLPDGYETIPVGDDTYYYYGGTFYINTAQGYQVVQAPIGAVVSQLPVGATDQDVNGETIMVYNNTYYQPISQDGQDAYEVVQGN